MRRREALGVLSAAAAWPLAGRAWGQDRIARIGWLDPLPAGGSAYDELLAGLRDLGWVEGKTLHIEARFAHGPDELPGLAAELVDQKVEVIVSVATGVYAAARATKTVPIVMVSAADVVAMGLVASLAHPGSNLTGQTFLAPELIAKRLEFLKTAAPSMTRAGVLLLRDSPANANALSRISVAAEALKVELRMIEVANAGELEGAISAAAGEPIGGLVSTVQAQFTRAAATIAAIAQKLGLPSIGGPLYASKGGLMGYGVDFAPMFRRAAYFVDKILKGAKPGDIPIEQATKFETIVNLKIAKALGLDIPPTLLAAADEVIE